MELAYLLGAMFVCWIIGVVWLGLRQDRQDQEPTRKLLRKILAHLDPEDEEGEP